MQTGELVLLLLLILVAAVVIALVLRRSNAKRAERQRVEAAVLRAEADAMAARMTGQTAFAQQAEERADLARAEAEAKAREAAELEAEAAERRATAEATRHEYESTMRRADDVDPDVEESSFAPVEDEPADAVAAGPADADAEPEPEPETDTEADGASDGVPMTRAERRQAREEAEARIDGGEPASPEEPEPEPEPEVVASGTAAASAWATPSEGADPESERIASAADFRDEVATGISADEVSPSAAQGTGEGMSTPSGSIATDPASYDDDLSQDVEIPMNEWGGPREDAVEPTATTDGSGADLSPEVIEEQATDELPAEEQATDELPAEAQPTQEHPGRRISGFLELRDGGYGVGSAAPIDDGAQPLDHPVQAYRDTMTFRAPGDPGYDSAEPDIWFYDAGAAERSGFRHADG